MIRISVSAAALIICLSASPAWSQSSTRGSAIPRPSSDVGGYTSRALHNLYRESIGTGYSINSVTDNMRQRSTGGIRQTQYSRPSSNLTSSGGFSSPQSSKPFSSSSPSPTVSPYLNLFLEDNTLGDTSVPIYNTLVRPQLNQQRLNQQIVSRGQELSRQVQSISAQPAFKPGGSEQQSPTGHQTVFQNTGRYFPLNFRRR